MYVCIYVCMFVCMYIYFNEQRSIRVLVRLGLDTLINWQQLDNVCMYICLYVFAEFLQSMKI